MCARTYMCVRIFFIDMIEATRRPSSDLLHTLDPRPKGVYARMHVALSRLRDCSTSTGYARTHARAHALFHPRTHARTHMFSIRSTYMFSIQVRAFYSPCLNLQSSPRAVPHTCSSSRLSRPGPLTLDPRPKQAIFIPAACNPTYVILDDVPESISFC